MATTTRKIGQNKAKQNTPARLWLEKRILSDNGWARGKRFNVEWIDDMIVYRANPTGTRAVAGSDSRPVIDTCTDDILYCLSACVGDIVEVNATPTRIIIRKA